MCSLSLSFGFELITKFYILRKSKLHWLTPGRCCWEAITRSIKNRAWWCLYKWQRAAGDQSGRQRWEFWASYPDKRGQVCIYRTLFSTFSVVKGKLGIPETHKKWYEDGHCFVSAVGVQRCTALLPGGSILVLFTTATVSPVFINSVNPF